MLEFRPTRKKEKKQTIKEEEEEEEFVCPYLDTVVTGDDASILHLDVGWRVGEFAFRVGAGALGALELAADLQLEPARVFGIDHVIEIVDVHHGHTIQTVTLGGPALGASSSSS